MEGNNGNLQDYLFENTGVLTIFLPPYWCKLIPTKLAFQTLVLARLNSEMREYVLVSDNKFHDDIDRCMSNFSYNNVDLNYIKCGYK